jgi:hypothetical protein
VAVGDNETPQMHGGHGAPNNKETWAIRTVRVFRQKFTLEDAIGSHACSLEASMRVTNGIPLGRPLSYRFTL